jgi:23S rRNA (uridine2552-2'-O)-methyltransferase
VLDLGAAPGSWSLYAAERVGSRGRVVAVDVQPIAQRFPENVTVIAGDVFDPGVLASLSDSPFDVVLSDMAPRTTGAKSGDRALSYELFMAALDVATRLGRPGSSYVGKLLMGEDYPLAQKAVKDRYERAKATKPEGTRSSSTEIFLVGVGLRSTGAR